MQSMTEKTCSACKQLKPIEEFGTNRAKSDGYQAHCKPCRKDFNSTYYLKTKELQNPKRYERRERALQECRSFLWAYLQVHPCVDCGESDIVVLQFDHVRGEKKRDVSKLVTAGMLPSLKEEVKKCDVRCANCHTRKTARQFGWLKLDFVAIS